MTALLRLSHADVLTILAALDDYEQTSSDRRDLLELGRASHLYNRFDALRFGRPS